MQNSYNSTNLPGASRVKAEANQRTLYPIKLGKPTITETTATTYDGEGEYVTLLDQVIRICDQYVASGKLTIGSLDLELSASCTTVMRAAS
jgi:hypothetical protein